MNRSRSGHDLPDVQPSSAWVSFFTKFYELEEELRLLRGESNNNSLSESAEVGQWEIEEVPVDRKLAQA